MAQPLISLTDGTDFAGDYVIERALNRGGMGAVYVALQKSTGRRRALKLMHPQLVSDARAVERFTREAKVGALIHSDHIVEVIGAGVDEKSGAPWLSMELLEGEDLAARLARGPMPAAEVGEVLKQVAHALGAAHDVGVVHRDLKPENVFLVQTRRAGGEVSVKVLDFGIAKVLAEATATSSGFIGTPAYMAPEQCAGGAVTGAADVWAFALMAFAMLTGKGYWKSMHLESGGAIQVLNEVATSPVVPASERATEYGLGDKLPEGFDAWFARATAREVGQRFANAREAWSALAPVFGMLPAPSALEDTAPSGSHPAHRPPVPPAAVAVTDRQVGRSPLWVRLLIGGALAVGLVGYPLLRRAPETPAVVAAPAAVPKPAAPPPPAPVSAPRSEDVLLFDVELGNSPTWGPADALVTIVEFADFECPNSRSAVEMLKKVRAQYPKDVRLVWKNYPLAIHHDAARASRFAREVLEERGPEAFWKVHDTLFENQGKFTKAWLLGQAKSVGADVGKVAGAIDAADLAPPLADDLRVANALVIEDTPTFYVNGHRYQHVSEPLEVVEKELTVAKKLVEKGVPRDRVYAVAVKGGLSGAPRPMKVLPKLPVTAYSRGSSSPVAVPVVELCDITNWQCVRQEPALRAAIDRHLADVSFTWISMVNPDAPESRLAARSLFSVRKADDFWKLHDAILAAQMMPEGLSPPADMFTARSLRGLAAKAGVDMWTYDRGVGGAIDDDLRGHQSWVRAVGVETARLYIDGEEYRGWEPQEELDKAIARAVERRKSKP